MAAEITDSEYYAVIKETEKKIKIEIPTAEHSARCQGA